MLVECLGNHKKKDYVSSVSRSVNTGKGGGVLCQQCVSVNIIIIIIMIKQEIYKASTGKQIVMVGRPELLSQFLPSFMYRLSVVHRKYLNVSEQNCNVYWSKV